MTTERLIRIMAGFVVLLSLGLGAEHSPIFHNVNWLWLNAFAGFNLFQSGFNIGMQSYTKHIRQIHSLKNKPKKIWVFREPR